MSARDLSRARIVDAQLAAVERARDALGAARTAVAAAAKECGASPILYGDPLRLAPTFSAIDRHIDQAANLLSVASSVAWHGPEVTP